MKLSTIILLFLIIGGLLLYLGGNYNLKNPQSRKSYLMEFGSWSVQLVKNVVHVTMFAIKQPWLPKDVNVSQVLQKVGNMNDSVNNSTSGNMINVTNLK